MIRESATNHRWLRLLICLAASVGVHAVLGGIGWRGAVAPPAAGKSPLSVALVDSRNMASGVAAPPAAAPSRAGSVAAPVRPAVPPPAASTRIDPPPVATPVCVAPEKTVVVDPPTEAGGDQGAATALPVGLPSMPGGAEVPGGGTDAPSGAAAGAAAPASDLTGALPRYGANPLPDYPRLARQNRWQGTVRLRARVTANGAVAAVALEQSSGHEVLDRAALDGVRRWRFIPASQGGVPVTCEVSIPVAFRLTEP